MKIRTSATLAATALLAVGSVSAGAATGALQFKPNPTEERYVGATANCDVRLSQYTKPGVEDSLPGVKKAMQAVGAKNGGTICVDGMYKIRNFIDLGWTPRNGSVGESGIKFIGSGTASGFESTTNAPIFYQNDGLSRYNYAWENLKLKKGSNTIGRIFDFRSGAQVNARFVSLAIDTGAKGSNNEVWHFDTNMQSHGGLYQSNRVEVRPTNNSGVLRVVSKGNFYNNNLHISSTWYKENNQGAPCAELRPSYNQYTNNSFHSITGQNCAGGFIHVYGQSGGGIYNSSNWDNKAGRVIRDSIRVGKTARSMPTEGYVLSGLGKVEQGTGTTALASGRHLIAVSPSTTGLTVMGTDASPVRTGIDAY